MYYGQWLQNVPQNNKQRNACLKKKKSLNGWIWSDNQSSVCLVLLAVRNPYHNDRIIPTRKKTNVKNYVQLINLSGSWDWRQNIIKLTQKQVMKTAEKWNASSWPQLKDSVTYPRSRKKAMINSVTRGRCRSRTVDNLKAILSTGVHIRRKL